MEVRVFEDTYKDNVVSRTTSPYVDKTRKKVLFYNAEGFLYLGW